MIKYYCDWCGQEIDEYSNDNYELDGRDFASSTLEWTQHFFGKLLCEECYNKRLSSLVDIDMSIFDEDHELVDKKKLDECYVVSYCNPFGGEPIVTAFDNKPAADACMKYFKDQKVGYVGLDTCPVYSEFKTDC